MPPFMPDYSGPVLVVYFILIAVMVISVSIAMWTVLRKSDEKALEKSWARLISDLAVFAMLVTFGAMRLPDETNPLQIAVIVIMVGLTALVIGLESFTLGSHYRARQLQNRAAASQEG